MNKAITDGINLDLPDFIQGLDQWSNQDGRPGDVTYDTVPAAAALFPSDPDFGDCLELTKINPTQKLRSVVEVPLTPGCYLQISARVKMVGALAPSVSIGAWAGDSSGNAITGVVQVGPATVLALSDQVVTISAIVGTGARTGVDMVWGPTAAFGHFGLDVTGPNGAVLRVESIEIVDITSAFHRTMMDWVDVTDYGAMGDGITDDAAAFEAADADANGRDVLVPSGSYFLGKSVSMLSRTRFEGTLVMATTHVFILRQNFEFLSYIDAFGSERLAFEKAFQALFHFADHEGLDLGGRHIQLNAPIDVHASVANVNNFSNRRAIRNGIFSANNTANWDDVVVTDTGSYDGSAAPRTLSNVANVASIPKGSLVQGPGVGREIYVTAKDEVNNTLTLSQPLYGAAAVQSYTFTRFQYLLDFSGFTRVANLQVEDIEFLCQRRCSALMLPPDGIAWGVRDCRFQTVKDRAITSIGTGDNGINIDRNQFISGDAYATPTGTRQTVAFNTNENDMKVRNNRAVNFRHFAVMAGGGHLIVGNHFWQADNEAVGDRTAGIIFCRGNNKTTLTGNYIDGHFLEWTNEYTAAPNVDGGLPWGTFTMVGNIFTAHHVPAWYRFIVLSPIGSHRIDGISVVGNAFKVFDSANIERVEAVNTANGSFDMAETRYLRFSDNSFSRVTQRTESPTTVAVDRTTVATSWQRVVSGLMPFDGQVLGIDGITAVGAIRNSSDAIRHVTPYVDAPTGASGQSFTVRWPEAVKGKLHVRVRCDQTS